MPNAALEQLVRTMTLEDLAHRSGRSVESIVQFAIGDGAAQPSRARKATSARPAPARASKPKNGKPTRPKTSSRGIDTRTAEGRETYDRAVLEALQAAGTPLRSEELRTQVGGTTLQLRTAVKRLEAEELIGVEGRARSTQYHAL